eukprot:CAMPEP_0185777550 /NCGR_PEP_ID=MMETSP1174-20130828/89885_1 /TAXON_ID=35687 /ORGANISM="Dictyocha speculum, Strain CCMP1381" /LENGTH=132 /DNA_ID=CAMNT_0028465957 /DNA_START=352 /DNA_END=747 /DNA_ORIENTATION=-
MLLKSYVSLEEGYPFWAGRGKGRSDVDCPYLPAEDILQMSETEEQTAQGCKLIADAVDQGRGQEGSGRARSSAANKVWRHRECTQQERVVLYSGSVELSLPRAGNGYPAGARGPGFGGVSECRVEFARSADG